MSSPNVQKNSSSNSDGSASNGYMSVLLDEMDNQSPTTYQPSFDGTTDNFLPCSLPVEESMDVIPATLVHNESDNEEPSSPKFQDTTTAESDEEEEHEEPIDDVMMEQTQKIEFEDVPSSIDEDQIIPSTPPIVDNEAVDDEEDCPMEPIPSTQQPNNEVDIQQAKRLSRMKQLAIMEEKLNQLNPSDTAPIQTHNAVDEDDSNDYEHVQVGHEDDHLVRHFYLNLTTKSY